MRTTTFDGTGDPPGDKCHRSQNAYPYLIQGKANVPQTLVDVACSGALIHNLTDGQNGEPPQYGALTDRTALVTIGIGGNDMGFADTVKACAKGPQLSGDFFQVTQTCHGRFDAQAESTLKDLNTPDPSDGLTKFERVYNTIRQKAPHARIVVIGYPHFFKPSGNFFGCNLIYRSDEKWMDAKIEEVDAVIEQNALAMGAEYTGGYSEFDGHELCGDGEEWLNGIVGVPPHSESFHPNKAGHVQISKILLDELQNHQPTATFTIQQNQTINYDFVVSSLQAVLSFLTSWPGSTVTTQLTDPNGRVITPTTAASDVFHSAGPTTELYKINNPAPGTWHVTLHGQDVAATGEPVALTVSQAPALNKLPVAVGTATANDAGTTVTYSAAGSYDPDGKIASYEWDFGDGTSATGSVVTHTYTNLGHLDQPTLLVTDNRGGLGFADMPNVKVHYGFQPLETFAPSPTVRSSKAGGSIRLSFRLTNPTGEPVSALSALTSYSFDESGGTYSVAYMPASRMYTITVTSPVTWRNTTRTFTLKLDDQSIHTVAVRFS